jgi:hypothetical protein
MMSWLVRTALHQRVLVVALFAVLAIVGVRRIPKVARNEVPWRSCSQAAAYPFSLDINAGSWHTPVSPLLTMRMLKNGNRVLLTSIRCPLMPVGP